MAEKIISPGVFSNEIDQTFLPSAIADIGACVIGPTVKGPVLVPTIVSSFSEYQNVFGTVFTTGSSVAPTTSSAFQFLTSHTAEQYLKHNNTLTVVRILAGSFTKASAQISQSIDPSLVGGGTHNTASFTFLTVASSDAAVVDAASSTSMSITPFGKSAVTFVFTGSFQSGSGNDVVANTATLIHVASGSSADVHPASVAAANQATARNLRDAINNSGSLHGLTSYVSASVDGVEVGLTSSMNAGTGINNLINGNLGIFTHDQTTPTPLQHGSQAYNFFDIVGSRFATALVSSTSGSGGGTDRHQALHGTSPDTPLVLTLKTFGEGDVMNSEGPVGTDSLLVSGSSDNIRYEISTINRKKGTFTLSIRKGNDIQKRKQVIETFTNVTLDPNSANFIGKAVGDQFNEIKTDENGKPYLQLTGDFSNKSKNIFVENITTTVDYLDENGNLRENDASASLPHFASGSDSGSRNGGFSGGSDGTVAADGRGNYMYHLITENNSQGLDPSGDGGDGGYNQYIQALDLISNQDEYDVNLILVPGIINSIHTSIASKVIDVCEDRGDCFAIIDPVEYDKNLTQATGQAKTRNSNFAAMYWPWVKVSDSQVSGTARWVPPSVMVSGVYAFNDKVSHEWFAPAGLNRGTIDTALYAERKLTQADRDELYDSSVNPIATFPGQGVTVFGQKTLQKKASALDRVNVRRLLIRVKKFIAASSRFLVFEQNTVQTRNKFLGIVNPFLENVQSQSGLSAFRVVMDETNNTPDSIDRNQLVGQLFLQPTRTAEFIVLDFTIQPTGASFPE